MAKLCELTVGFMESFLKNNPTATADSNGYLRTEYEAEIKRRAEYVPPVVVAPTNRDEWPQFKCVSELDGADHQPKGEPDNFQKAWPPTPENIGLF